MPRDNIINSHGAYHTVTFQACFPSHHDTLSNDICYHAHAIRCHLRLLRLLLSRCGDATSARYKIRCYALHASAQRCFFRLSAAPLLYVYGDADAPRYADAAGEARACDAASYGA